MDIDEVGEVIFNNKYFWLLIVLIDNPSTALNSILKSLSSLLEASRSFFTLISKAKAAKIGKKKSYGFDI